MKRLYVWVRTMDGSLSLAGEIATTDPVSGGRFESEFEYAAQWVRDPAAFPLDPVSLPLQPLGQRFRAEQLYPPLAVIDDALPDDWGRRLLAKALTMEGRSTSPPDMLLALRAEGTGALLFTGTPQVPVLSSTLHTRSLTTLLAAAAQFETGVLPADPMFRELLEGSGRAGGARPKALVHDAHGEWIAKFPSRTRDGHHDVVGLEATCLRLARLAGLTVPDSQLQMVGRRRVLLVRRFDVTPHGGRLHMVSMRTLCRERPGLYVTSYTDIALLLSKHSVSPAEDVSALFRHMVFNAAIGNVDDHLKNFWMLRTPAGYRLAPAFDLVPDTNGRGDHALAFQHSFSAPTRRILLDLAQDWHVTQAGETIDQAVEAVSTFRKTAIDLGVRPGAALKAICADVTRRVAALTQRDAATPAPGKFRGG